MAWPYDPVAVENIIRQGGAQYGYDPDLAMQIFQGEGFKPNTYQSRVPTAGGAEQSYGPFQLYMGGGMGNQFQQQTGLDPRDPSTVTQQAEWVAKQIPQTGWTPWNAAKNMGIGPWQGINRGGATNMYEPTQAAPAAPAEPATTGSIGGDLHSGWRDFLSNDDNRAALFQLGISLMQPIGVGQSVAGHIGQALGQAGEVYGTRDEMRQKQETADQTSLYNQQKLELERQKLAQDAPETAARTAAYGRQYRNAPKVTGQLTEYQKASLVLRLSKEWETQANDPLRDTTQPFPTKDEYIQQGLASLGLGELYQPGQQGATAAPTTAEPAGATSTNPAASIDWWKGRAEVQQAVKQYQQLVTSGAAKEAEEFKQQVIEAAKARGGPDLSPLFGATPTAPAGVSSIG